MGRATERRGELLASDWREQALRRQQAVLPEGSVVATCGVPFGSGGLGRHLAEIMQALERDGRPGICICDDDRPPEGAPGIAERLLRRSPGRRVLRARREFDRFAAGRLPVGADALMAFNRQALDQFGRAKELGYSERALVTGSPHVSHVARQHAAAYRRDPVERSFGTYVVERYLDEYATADHIYVASDYTRDSFVAEGIEPERIRIFPLTPDPRFVAPAEPPSTATFDIVYIGAVSVAKGIPVLVDAVAKLDYDDLRLRLVGSTKSRPMASWLAGAITADGRISAAAGDPLPPLEAASLCVHPTWEDGFAYAPAEALACGVPAIVSEDTGMKELITPGVNGATFATGDADALAEAIDAAYRGELLDAKP